MADHVLSRFSKEERELIDMAVSRAAAAVKKILTDGVDAAMNEYNRKQVIEEE